MQGWKARDLGQLLPVSDARRQERGEGGTYPGLPRSQEREMQKERNPQILNSCQDVSPTARQASHCLKAEVGCGVERSGDTGLSDQEVSGQTTRR